MKNLSFTKIVLGAFLLASVGCEENTANHFSDARGTVESEESDLNSQFLNEENSVHMILDQSTVYPAVLANPLNGSKVSIRQAISADKLILSLKNLPAATDVEISQASEGLAALGIEQHTLTALSRFAMHVRSKNGHVPLGSPAQMCLDQVLPEGAKLIVDQLDLAANTNQLQIKDVTVIENKSCFELESSNTQYGLYLAQEDSPDQNESQKDGSAGSELPNPFVDQELSLLIDAGASKTNASAVAIEILAADPAILNHITHVAVSDSKSCADLEKDWIDFTGSPLEFELDIFGVPVKEVTLNVLLKDSNDSISPCLQQKITYDALPPMDGVLTVEDGQKQTRNLSFSIKLQSAEAVSYALTLDGEESVAADDFKTLSEEIATAFELAENSADGDYKVFALLKDDMGNLSKLEYPITLDRTPPQLSSFKFINHRSANEKNYINNLTTPFLEIEFADAAEIYLTLEQSCSDGGEWQKISSNAQYAMSLPSGALSDLYYKAKDTLGNESGCLKSDQPIMYDPVAPEVDGFGFLNPVTWTLDGSKSPILGVDTSKAMSDADSGLASYQLLLEKELGSSERELILDWFDIGLSLETYQLTELSLEKNASYTISLRGRDFAGNTSLAVERDSFKYHSYDAVTYDSPAGVVPQDYFGQSVGISGEFAIVGAHQSTWRFKDPTVIETEYAFDSQFTGAGKIFLYKRVAGEWQLKGNGLQPAGVSDKGDGFGSAVAISGNYAIAGAHRFDPSGFLLINTGSVFVYKTSDDGENWSHTATLDPSDKAPSASERLGVAVDIDGRLIVAGASGKDSGGLNDSGSAYFYERTEGTDNWVEKTIATASDKAAEDYFGHSVAISGDLAVIGAMKKDAGGVSNAGAAYVFKRNVSNGTWQEVATLTAEDNKIASGHFGFSVDISGSLIVVGAHYENVSGQLKAGAAYVFKSADQGVTWERKARFTKNDPIRDDRFASTVSIVSDSTKSVVAVGRTTDDSYNGSVVTPTVFLFHSTDQGETWSEQMALSDPQAEGYRDQTQRYGIMFTGAVGLSDQYLIGGTFFHNYSFTVSSGPPHGVQFFDLP